MQCDPDICALSLRIKSETASKQRFTHAQAGLPAIAQAAEGINCTIDVQQRRFAGQRQILGKLQPCFEIRGLDSLNREVLNI